MLLHFPMSDLCVWVIRQRHCNDVAVLGVVSWLCDQCKATLKASPAAYLVRRPRACSGSSHTVTVAQQSQTQLDRCCIHIFHQAFQEPWKEARNFERALRHTEGGPRHSGSTLSKGHASNHEWQTCKPIRYCIRTYRFEQQNMYYLVCILAHCYVISVRKTNL